MARKPKPCSSAAPSPLPASPDKAQLDRVPNPHPDTELCRALHRAGVHHAVPDHRPAGFRPSGHRLRAGDAGWSKSKSLKLYLDQLPQPGRVPRGLHRRHRQAAVRAAEAEMAAHRRLLVSARRHSDRRVLAGRQIAEGRLGAGPGRRALSRPRLTVSRQVASPAAAANARRSSRPPTSTRRADDAAPARCRWCASRRHRRSARPPAP